MEKKFTIKIPSSIRCIFDHSKNTLLLKGSENFITLQLHTKLILNLSENSIYFTIIPLNIESNRKTAYLNAYRGTTSSSIKKFINQSQSIFYKKLILVGIGYRSSLIKNNSNILKLKLGYSHPIFISIPEKIKILCPKPNIIYIFGTNYSEIDKIVSCIRAYRCPEPYKGKGVLKEYENVYLKEGKKAQ